MGLTFHLSLSHAKVNLIIILLSLLFLQSANKSGDGDIDPVNPCDDKDSHCDTLPDFETLSSTFLTVRDSLDKLWKEELDKDDNDYCTAEELIESIKSISEIPLSDAAALEKSIRYLKYLDGNGDTVLDLYEIRLMIYKMANTPRIEFKKQFESHDSEEFVQWLEPFIGESPKKYPFYLVKIYQTLDEDMNAKLTWKEIRGIIKLAELFIAVKENNLMEERNKEDLVATIKQKYQQKWLDISELSLLLSEIGAGPYDVFYSWICEYLQGNFEKNSTSVSDETRKHFRNIDADSNGVLTKGELIAALHRHRKGYYTDERINRRWTRADRNEDGEITFNEYAFLENLKHPERK